MTRLRILSDLHIEFGPLDLQPVGEDILILASGAAVWCHGHIHNSADYMIAETRVICNPRGYIGHELNPDFDPNLTVET